MEEVLFTRTSLSLLGDIKIKPIVQKRKLRLKEFKESLKIKVRVVVRIPILL